MEQDIQCKTKKWAEGVLRKAQVQREIVAVQTVRMKIKASGRQVRTRHHEPQAGFATHMTGSMRKAQVPPACTQPIWVVVGPWVRGKR